MVKRTLLIWTVRLVLVLICVVSVATILLGLFVTRYGILAVNPPTKLCQFSVAGGKVYTIYQSEGSTTVGSGVGIYEGHDENFTRFDWWFYETGQVRQVSKVGELLLVVVRSVEQENMRSDTIVIDLTKENDYIISTDSLSGPSTIVCDLAPD